MPIVKLNASTASLIGSSASITSPYAVVKELLDNAIDAGAGSVEITISSNTLDSLRVRDNGRGISVDDLGCLGRPAHTSKLATFDELNDGRITTFGFRGQSMANINRIASVHIITKTAEEPIATKVRLAAQHGGVGKTFPPVSAPRGTTVQVDKMFENMPPRRQSLLKECKRTMARVRDLLAAYVLANADLCITFRVLGDDKQSCKYGLTRERDLKQSVLEVFGAKASASGETHRYYAEVANAEDDDDAFTLLALLPTADCQASAAKTRRGGGVFVSVNGRPMDPTAGIAKALATVFRANMQQSWQRRGLPPISQPLLVLAITCPFASYDVNVATMKDNVLFADEQLLLKAFGDMCRAVYDRAPQGDGRGGSASALAAEREEAPQPVKLITATMRTRPKINMLRTDSNVSEMEEGLIEVEIPESSAEVQPSKPRKRISGIERYFQPSTVDSAVDFDIATDDTAMPELPTCVEEGENRRPNTETTSCRRPLSVVPDSTLNMLAGMQDSCSETSSQGEAPRLSDLYSTWNLGNTANNNNNNNNVHRSLAGRRQIGSSSPAIGNLLPGLAHGGGTANPQLSMAGTTPPPSDPHTEQSFLPASYILRSRQPWPARSSSDGSGSDSGSGRGSGSGSDSDSGSDSPANEFRMLQQPQRNRLPRNARGGHSKVVVVPTREPRRSNATAAGRRGALERHRVEREDNNNYRGEVELPSRIGRSAFSSSGEEQPVQKTVCHSTQAACKRRCLADVEEEEEEEEAGACHQSPRLGVVGAVGADLALETIPESMAMWKSILVVGMGLREMRMSMYLHKEVDRYIQSGELELGLSRLTAKEAEELALSS